MSLAVPAIGLLAYTGNDATDGKIVTVGTVTYTLKTGSLTAAGHVAIVPGNPDATVRNLGYAINGVGGVVGTDYYSTPANGAASALLDAVNNVLRLQARAVGATGNAVALTTNEPEFTAPGTLSGGIDGTGLVAWSLVTLDEAKLALRVRGNEIDDEIAWILGAVADQIEFEILYRPVADLGTGEPEADLEEWHDLANPQGFLYLRNRPIRSVTALYIAGNLIDSSNYVVDRAASMLTLVGSTVTRPMGLLAPVGQSFALSGPWVNAFPEDAWRLSGRYFPAGQSTARVLYKGGYASTDTVSPNLKMIALDMAARIYRTRERKSQGVTSEITQGFTIATKYDPKVMTDDIKARLRDYTTLTKTARQ